MWLKKFCQSYLPRFSITDVSNISIFLPKVKNILKFYSETNPKAYILLKLTFVFRYLSHTGSKRYWYVICFIGPTAVFKISSLIISRTDFFKRFFVLRPRSVQLHFGVSLTNAPQVELEILRFIYVSFFWTIFKYSISQEKEKYILLWDCAMVSFGYQL